MYIIYNLQINAETDTERQRERVHSIVTLHEALQTDMEDGKFESFNSLFC